MKEQIQEAIAESIKAKNSLDISSIEQAATLIISTLKQGNKLLLAGNGGSAADAQHIAAELVGRFLMERPGLPAIALTTDSSNLTAIGNDYGYEAVFQRQIQALGREGDLFLAISTSGNSPNLLTAVDEAKSKGLTTMALTGNNGGKLASIVQHHINVPHSHTARIQESHILIGHILCDLIETSLFPNNE